jgi:hypothetical protein
MRPFLALLTCLCLANGCYGTSTDSDESGGAGAVGGTAGQTSGGRTSGTSGSSSAGTDAGGSSTAGTGFGGTSCRLPECDGIICEGADSTFATIDKSCQTSTDCVLVEHLSDCCGSMLIMAINHGAEATFASAETQCNASQPVCECAPQDTALEDGTRVGIGDISYASVCLDGQCRSTYVGGSFACGDIRCTEQQQCTLVSGGQPDSGTSASCSSLGDCKSCDCLPASAGCGCTQDQTGYITVSCAAP